MKLKLHHINLSTSNVTELDRFYRDVIGLAEEDENLLPQLERKKGFESDVAFATDGDVQLHMAEMILKPLNDTLRKRMFPIRIGVTLRCRVGIRYSFMIPKAML